MGRPRKDRSSIPIRSKWDTHSAFLRRSVGGREDWLKSKLDRSMNSIIKSFKRRSSDKDDNCFKSAFEFYNYLLSSNGFEPYEIDYRVNTTTTTSTSRKELDTSSLLIMGSSESEEGEEELCLTPKEEESSSKSLGLLFNKRGKKRNLLSTNKAHRDGSIRVVKKLSSSKLKKSLQNNESLSSESEELTDNNMDQRSLLVAYIPGKLLKCQIDDENNLNGKVTEENNNKNEKHDVENNNSNKKRKKDTLLITTPTTSTTPEQPIKQRTLSISSSSKITDSLTPRDIDINAPRSRRSRKQPTLYDPQICAASVWQSDIQVEKALNGELDSDSSDSSSSSTDESSTDEDKKEEDDEEEEANKEEDEVSILSKKFEEDICKEIINNNNNTSSPNNKALVSVNDNNKSSVVWCDFCQDDRSISVCCFCACRVCFSKHDEKKLLLCDNCDAEYHIYCLTPRLKEVPKDKWYCPDCRDTMMNKEKDDGNMQNKKISSNNNELKTQINSYSSSNTIIDSKKRSSLSLLRSKKGRHIGRNNIIVRVKLLSKKKKQKIDTTTTTTSSVQHVHVFVKSNKDTTKSKKEKDNIPVLEPVKSKNFVIPRRPSMEKSKNEKKYLPAETTMRDLTTETTTKRKKDISLQQLTSSIDNTMHHLSRKVPRKSRNHQIINSEKLTKSTMDNTFKSNDTKTNPLLKSTIPVVSSSLKLETISTQTKTNITNNDNKNNNNELPRAQEKSKGSSNIDTKEALPSPVKNTTQEVRNNAHHVNNKNIAIDKITTSSSSSMNNSSDNTVKTTSTAPIASIEKKKEPINEVPTKESIIDNNKTTSKSIKENNDNNLAKNKSIIKEFKNVASIVPSPPSSTSFSTSKQVPPPPSSTTATTIRLKQEADEKQQKYYSNINSMSAAFKANDDMLTKNLNILKEQQQQKQEDQSLTLSLSSLKKSSKEQHYKNVNNVVEVQNNNSNKKMKFEDKEEINKNRAATTTTTTTTNLDMITKIPKNIQSANNAKASVVGVASSTAAASTYTTTHNPTTNLMKQPTKPIINIKAAAVAAPAITTTSTKSSSSITNNTASLEAMKKSFAMLSSSIHVPIKVVNNDNSIPSNNNSIGYSDTIVADRVKSVFPSSDVIGSMTSSGANTPTKVPRRKPGARECMQISRRFGINVIPEKYMDILLDYCTRGKVEHLIRMRERLDEHSRMLELQYAGLECSIKEKDENDIIDISSSSPNNINATTDATTTNSIAMSSGGSSNFIVSSKSTAPSSSLS